MRPADGGGGTQGIEDILRAVAEGRLSPAEGLASLRDAAVADLGFARVDTLREARTGLPEIIYGEGKLPEEIVTIAQRLHAAHGRFLVTRAATDAVQALRAWRADVCHRPRARTATLDEGPPAVLGGRVLVVAAGTTDLPVAEEVAETLRFCRREVHHLTDVGVAGLHRLLAELPRLRSADVIVAVAGMEGTLPGVIAGLTARPVIGVPTSVGYGVAAGGHAALHTMLASCSPGLAVVNIDNGCGAAVLAHRILSLAAPTLQD